MKELIEPSHLQRLAIVYVRQSSDKQILNNPESPLRQRALQTRAAELGWPSERILLLQEQRGETASSPCRRHAYRQLAELVIQDRVGIILAVEVARWARDNAAWQLLLRDCMFAKVLLADEHTVYDPNDANDRVRLGILGVLAEYELSKLRDRMLGCWWNKARRCEIFPAYISWQQYEENVAKIRKAATMFGDASRAAVQRGSALLAGLLRCRRCGRPLSVRYDASGPRYECKGGRTARQRGKPCLSFSGRYLEPLFSEAVLEAVRPAGVAAAQRAAELARREFQQRWQGLADELQQRQYEVQRARRQYDRVEPENRLVATSRSRKRSCVCWWRK